MYKHIDIFPDRPNLEWQNRNFQKMLESRATGAIGRRHLLLRGRMGLQKPLAKEKPKKVQKQKPLVEKNPLKGTTKPTISNMVCDFPGYQHVSPSIEDNKSHWQCCHEDEDKPFLLDECKKAYSDAAEQMVPGSLVVRKFDVIKSFRQNTQIQQHFENKGLLHQSPNDQGGNRTIHQWSPKIRYKVKYKIPDALPWSFQKPYGWWVLFLHQEGVLLDKFILDTLIGCEVSHLCHWSKCLVLSDLILELPYINKNRNGCKNWDRRYTGGCQASGSKHVKLKPCIPQFWERKILAPFVSSITA